VQENEEKKIQAKAFLLRKRIQAMRGELVFIYLMEDG